VSQIEKTVVLSMFYQLYICGYKTTKNKEYQNYLNARQGYLG